MTYCVGISCVRNESDIIELMVRYNLHLLDELHVIDNLSADRTRWILQQLKNEGLPLHIHVSDNPSHQQEQLVSQLARELAMNSKVDFVVPLDADELLSIPSRREFHAALATIPPDTAGAIFWQTYLPEPDTNEGQAFFRQMTRFRTHEDLGSVKLILRGNLCKKYVWSAGCHNAFHDETREPILRVDLPFRLAHFPVRDAMQLARKVLVGAHALSLKKTRFEGEGWHWMALARQLREANYKVEILNPYDIALSYSLEAAIIPSLKVLQGAVPDFPDVQQRYPVEQLSLETILEHCQNCSPGGVILNNKDMNKDIATLWQKLSTSAAQPIVWLSLARAYADHGLSWQAGYAARQALRLDASLLQQLQALKIENWQDATAGDTWLGRINLSQSALLAEQFSAQVQACPGDWLSWLYLARLQEMLSVQHAAIQQAKSLEPIPGESLHWMGVWRLHAGDAQGAVAALSGLLNIRPVRFGSMMYLGEALLRTNQIQAAEKAFARASLSNNPDFLLTLSAKVYTYNYWQEAIEVLQKAITLRPDNVPILLALAKIHWEVYQLSEAQENCHHVLRLEAGNKDAAYMLAALPGRMGDAKGHLDAVQKKYAESDDPTSRLASSIAMASLYHDEMSTLEVADLHRRLCAPIEAALTQKKEFTNQRTATLNRRLRIGCVTGDLHRQHPVNIFMLPVLQRFDHERFEIFVYHTGTMHDEYTRRAEACADVWLEAATLDDPALQQAIVNDEIDILIDLAGHTSSHRLGVFAMRAAPVQATFLGYPHSTGLSAMDWLIGDAVVSPVEHAHLFSEGIAQLPGSVFCWAPVDEYPMPPARPADASVVFGSFNNAMKLSPKTIGLWANILHTVPDAKLLLKAPSLRDNAVQARFSNLFAEQGIAPERLILRGPSGLADMMQEYGDIDIALDPTPYNGGTTTLQALWMGVPTLTLAGGNFVSRMGASFMQSLGQPDWVAKDEAEYVAQAVTLARNCHMLRNSRAVLRQQMANSPVCDIDNYVRHFEALLRRMWQVYCDGDQSRLIKVQ